METSGTSWEKSYDQLSIMISTTVETEHEAPKQVPCATIETQWNQRNQLNLSFPRTMADTPNRNQWKP